MNMNIDELSTEEILKLLPGCYVGYYNVAFGAFDSPVMQFVAYNNLDRVVSTHYKLKEALIEA